MATLHKLSHGWWYEWRGLNTPGIPKQTVFSHDDRLPRSDFVVDGHLNLQQCEDVVRIYNSGMVRGIAVGVLEAQANFRRAIGL